MGCGGELLEDRRRLPRRRLRAKSSFSSQVSSTFITCSLNVGSPLPVCAANGSSDPLRTSCLEATFVLSHLLNNVTGFKTRQCVYLQLVIIQWPSYVFCAVRVHFLIPLTLTCILNNSSLMPENTSY